jgi:hypothetical protein
MSGIGHNRGPELDADFGWRRFAWGKARAALVPTLPLEIIRLHVTRAAELGLPYKTYAGVRASTGRDVIGFLFSSNALLALRAGQGPDPARAARVASLVRVDRTAMIRAGQAPAAFVPPCDDAWAAPTFTDPWPVVRDRIATIVRARGLPPDGILLVGETQGERDWAEAGRLAGFLSGDRYFAA